MALRLRRPASDGPGLVAKALMGHGTPEQCERFLPDLRLGRINFCLGYSEPDAGSDLASVRTRHGACPTANTSSTARSAGRPNAHWSDYIWLLCRTGPADSRARGLSILIVPLDHPGCPVPPIPTHDGGRLNEVRFDGACRRRTGWAREPRGWQVAGSALAVERHVQFPPKRLRRDVQDLAAWVRDTGLDGDPVVRRTLGDLAVKVAEVEALGLALLGEIISGQPSAVPAAYHKLAGTLLTQDIARAALEFGSPEALVKGTDVEFMWRQAILETIGGGTSGMMRGLVARQAFGLER
ncbi:acyl-CoA dehydrogenase family protein [Yinghuangia aomiensis]